MKYYGHALIMAAIVWSAFQRSHSSLFCLQFRIKPDLNSRQYRHLTQQERKSRCRFNLQRSD